MGMVHFKVCASVYSHTVCMWVLEYEQNIQINMTFKFFLFMDRASLDIEILLMSNEMQLFMFFITNDALHVSGVLRPSSGAL
jgi:hypothetical protein